MLCHQFQLYEWTNGYTCVRVRAHTHTHTHTGGWSLYLENSLRQRMLTFLAMQVTVCSASVMKVQGGVLTEMSRFTGLVLLC